MRKNIRDLLGNWPRFFIQDADISRFLRKTGHAHYSAVKRAIKDGLLTRVKMGLYIVNGKTKQSLPDEFEFATLIFEPSFVSLESALSYHLLIPEFVESTTCVSTRRAKDFKTPVGVFCYKRVPEESFDVGVEFVETKTGGFSIATPWRAISDFVCTRCRSWKKLEAIEAELEKKINKEMPQDPSSHPDKSPTLPHEILPCLEGG